MDLLLDTVGVFDAEGRFVFVNAACERLFVYTQRELIGRHMIELVWPDPRERTLQAAVEIMDGRPKTHFESRYVRKAGPEPVPAQPPAPRPPIADQAFRTRTAIEDRHRELGGER